MALHCRRHRPVAVCLTSSAASAFVTSTGLIQVALVIPETHGTPATKNRPPHTKRRSQTRTRRVLLCSITLLASLTKSARIHKRSQMHALSHMQPTASKAHSSTGAYAPGAAAWVARASGEPLRRAGNLSFQTRPSIRLTDRDNTNTPDKEDKARAQCKAPRCCVQCEHHAR